MRGAKLRPVQWQTQLILGFCDYKNLGATASFKSFLKKEYL